MRVRTIRKQDEGRDDQGMLLEVARLYLDGLSQSEVGKKLDLSQSKVSRLLDHARQRGIIKVYLDVPAETRLQAELMGKLRHKGVHEVVVVPGGPGKNVQNLGEAGARLVVDKVNKIPKSTVGITMACGDTLREVLIDRLPALLQREPAVLREFRNKRLQLHPSALYADIQLKALYPHALVIALAMGLWGVIESNHIEAFTPSLPPNFYSLSDDQRKKYLEEHSYKKILKHAKEAEIILLGIGTPTEPKYKEILKQLIVNQSENIINDYSAEINYIPIRQDGHENAEVESKLVGIKIHDLREIAKDPNRYVVAIGGGEAKREAIRAALIDPCFNTLITDQRIAEYLLDYV